MLDECDGLPLDVAPDVEAKLRAVGEAWFDEPLAERLMLEALAMAPDALRTRIGTYKFYFYRQRLEACLPHALSCVDFAADGLGIGRDWRAVQAGDAPFSALTPLPKLWLQALMAYGYVLARMGRLDEGREALSKVAQLDQQGKLGAHRLVDVIDRGGVEVDEYGDDEGEVGQ
jgi:hypothetical protein